MVKKIVSHQILTMGEKNNIALTQVMVNALWPLLESLDQLPEELSPSELTQRPEIQKLLETLPKHLHNLDVVRVKIYNLHGQTLLSTQLNQIGEDQSKNSGFRSALRGEVQSELIYRHSFPSFDGTTEERSLISSYLPLRSTPHQPIHGVLELYTDIAPLLADIEHTQWILALWILAILAILYGLFLYFGHRLDHTIQKHEAERKEYINKIKEQNLFLEQNIEERTKKLTQTNIALQIEVAVRRQAEEELCLAASVYQNTSEGIAVTDSDGTIRTINPAFTEITGYTAEEVLGQHLLDVKSKHSPEDNAFLEKWQYMTTSGKWRGEIWSQRKNGENYHEWCNLTAVRDGEGKIIRYVTVFSDISSIKKSEEKLEFLSHHDPLTQLPNRLLLQDRMHQALSYANRLELLVGVLFLGLDRFKLINHSAGRHVGDQLLTQTAKRLEELFREEDTVARVGGDEFVVLVTGILEVRNITIVAQKLLDAISQPFDIDGQNFFLNASIGITIFPFDNGDINTLLQNASAAMSKAKEQGGNNFHFFTQEMGDLSAKRLALENGLRTALQKQEFILYYQPQIDVASGRLAGVEALIRWQSPELGLISPINFIPLAEETNLIVPLGEWILRTACAQNVQWMEAGYAPIRMAVNISARQFQNQDLVAVVRSALTDTGLSPQYLELELTEGMFMEDLEKTIQVLDELKKMGVHLSIDDFGTGYSSLSYLKRFPINTLKIDRAFVRDITTDPDDAAITKTIISMCKNLNLTVVAEGVASVKQLEFLRGLGCDFVQGFLFSPPVTPAEITLFLEEDGRLLTNISTPSSQVD
ncbi:MAG: EAL domain-containing protein [Magnetococcus sp. DMHC-6]